MDQRPKIAVLTSGGDSPGMNAAVSSVARFGAKAGFEVVGILNGYKGLVGITNGEDGYAVTMDTQTVIDMADKRGTLLGTARCLEFKNPEVRAKVAAKLKELGYKALVVIGGDGSMTGAVYLAELGISVVGIPGTIDNDLGYTEKTLGFDTAVSVCVEAVRNVRAMGRGLDRPQVVEVMGRYCGDIALHTAMATGAELLIVPTVEWDIDEVAARLRSLIAAGNKMATLVISEHSWDNMKPYDWRGFLKENGVKVYDDEEMTSYRLAEILTLKCGLTIRANVLGYIQRGAIPSAADSEFAFECGKLAVELITADMAAMEAGTRSTVGSNAIGIRDGKVFAMPIAEALAMKNPFNEEMYNAINTL